MGGAGDLSIKAKKKAKIKTSLNSNIFSIKGDKVMYNTHIEGEKKIGTHKKEKG